MGAPSDAGGRTRRLHQIATGGTRKFFLVPLGFFTFVSNKAFSGNVLMGETL